MSRITQLAITQTVVKIFKNKKVPWENIFHTLVLFYGSNFKIQIAINIHSINVTSQKSSLKTTKSKMCYIEHPRLHLLTVSQSNNK